MNWGLSDVLSVISISFSFFSVLFTLFVNRKASDNRYLKGIFIDKILKLEEDYNCFFLKIYQSSIKAKEIYPELKILRKKDMFLEYLKNNYSIDNEDFLKNHNDLRDFFEEKEEFKEAFKKNDPVFFSEENKNQLIRLQENYGGVFLEKIIKVNNYRKCGLF
ncbi:hypothetical protein ACQ1R0_05780 [Ornithobacterium rhinotracheale]|uniref:hypothetical protein n=1 Tax=Ornithobacterium rhinotracheale TaxID=28251 RepID=UPI00403A5C3B